MSAVATAEAVAGSDTLRDSLAAKGNSLAALILPKDDPRRARRQTAFAARDTAKTCGRCGRALGSDEPVWREQCAQESGLFGGTRSILAPVCDACHSQYGRFWRAPCKHCKRPVYNAIGFQGRDVFCSERCHGELHKARLRQRRAEARGTKTCPTCGEGFAPSRNDQVTCSSACRQKAHRQRVTDKRRRAARPPESVTADVSEHGARPNSRNGGPALPAFLDRRNTTNAKSSDEGRSG